MDEFSLIAQLTRGLPTGGRTLTGVGDDCAVLRGSGGSNLLVTSDMLVEGVHFRSDTIGWPALGAKALTCGLSDVAAMGGTPLWATVSIAVPERMDAVHVQAVYEGLADQARRYAVDIVGGDTVSSSEGLVIDVTLIGEVPVGLALLRSAARPGDVILVTGLLGDSAAGLDVLMFGDPDAAETRGLVGAHQWPTPRLDVAQHLIDIGTVHACIDLSDGLAGDMGHVCKASEVSAVFFEEALPVSAAMQTHAQARRTDPLAWAFAGGEDYELAFTMPLPAAKLLLAEWNNRGATALSMVGTIEPGPPALRLRRRNGVTEDLPYTGFSHLSSNR